MRKNKSILELENALSTDRIQKYIAFVKQKSPSKSTKSIQKDALDLYKWNIKISSALFEIIGIYEVTIRNKIFNLIDKNFLYSIQNNNLKKSTRTTKKIDDAIQKITDSGKTVTNGLIVSRLSFAVWGFYLKKIHFDHNTMKTPHKLNKFVQQMFDPNFKINRQQANKLVYDISILHKEINEIRNRICHHEAIYHFNLKSVYLKILNTIEYLDYNTFIFTKKTQRVRKLLNKKPKYIK